MCKYIYIYIYAVSFCLVDATCRLILCSWETCQRTRFRHHLFTWICSKWFFDRSWQKLLMLISSLWPKIWTIKCFRKTRKCRTFWNRFLCQISRHRLNLGNVKKKKKKTFSAISQQCYALSWFSHATAGSLLRSYKRSFNGFAARLTKEEAQILSSMWN